jgi:hypothetical protein
VGSYEATPIIVTLIFVHVINNYVHVINSVHVIMSLTIMCMSLQQLLHVINNFVHVNNNSVHVNSWFLREFWLEKNHFLLEKSLGDICIQLASMAITNIHIHIHSLCPHL